MENNEYMEYTLYNPKNSKYQQFVVNDGSDIVQVYNRHLEVNESFESEAYHLSTYAKENGLSLHVKVKQFTPLEEIIMDKLVEAARN